MMHRISIGAAVDAGTITGCRYFSTQLKVKPSPSSSTGGAAAVLGALPSWIRGLFPKSTTPWKQPRESIRKLAKQNPPRLEFYPLAQSPHPQLREYARQIVESSSCPTCLDQENVLPKDQWNSIHNSPTSLSEPQPKSAERPVFCCPDCGWPTHCSKEHWEQDQLEHAKVCSTLKQWTMDEHDLLSGRKFWEMTFPGRQNIDAVLNFTSWPYIFNTRKFSRPTLENATAQRHISRFLTYPYTVASLLHKPWVYYRMQDTVSTTNELQENLSEEQILLQEESVGESPPPKDQLPVVTDIALSHAVDVATKTAAVEFSRIKNKARRIAFSEEPTAPTLNNDPFRIFIVGPRFECRLPTFIWEQLSMTFPGVPFRLYFIGPDAVPPQMPAMSNAEPLQKHRQVFSSGHQMHVREITVPVKSNVESTDDEQEEPEMKTIQSVVLPSSVNLRMEYIQSPYETVHETFGKFQRRRDIFIMFNSGVGHPATREQWKPAIEKILKTRCLAVFTSLNEEDQERDIRAVQEDYAGEYVVAMRPCRNKFSSLRPDIPADCVHDSRHWAYGNWGLFAIHGVGTEMGNRLEDIHVNNTAKKSWWTW